MSLNAELSQLFASFAAIMELKGESAFKAIAFQKVSRILKDANIDLRQLMKENKLDQIEGVGKSSQEIIEQYLRTGKSAVFDEVAASVPAGLLPMLGIEGLGPKTVRLLWQERDITSIDSLSKAIEGGKLDGLKGIGEKKIAAIRLGIETHNKRVESGAALRTGIGEALPAARELLEQVRAIPKVLRAELAGSLRRRRETIADIDIVVGVKDIAHGGPISDVFVKLPGITQILAHGASKSSVKIKSGMQADLRIVPEENFGAALLYFTGSKEHNVKIRGLSLKKNMTLNEWGLYSLDEYDKAKKEVAKPPAIKPIASKTEESIYAKLGMAYVEPELREDRGEVEAALFSGHLLPEKSPSNKDGNLKEAISKFMEREFEFKIIPTPQVSSKSQLEDVESRIQLEFPVGAGTDKSRWLLLPRWSFQIGQDFRIRGSDTDPKIADRSKKAWKGDQILFQKVMEKIEDHTPWYTAKDLVDGKVVGSENRGIYVVRSRTTSSERVANGRIGIAYDQSIQDRLEKHFLGKGASSFRDKIEEYLASANVEAETCAPGLPKLITLKDIRGDLHTHTTASDGSNSLEEMANAAKALGYEYLAVTDHSKAMAMARGLTVDRLLKHIEEIHNLSDRLKGITLLAGSEVDILADGTMDYEDDVLKELDIVIASPHVALKQDARKATDRLLRAIDNRYVNVIGHPTGRLINQREGLPLEMSALFKAAAANGTAMEINAGYPRLDLDEYNAKAALSAGVTLTIDTDAHDIAGLNQLDLGIGVARRAWVTAANVLNTQPLEKLRAFLKKKR